MYPSAGFGMNDMLRTTVRARLIQSKKTENIVCNMPEPITLRFNEQKCRELFEMFDGIAQSAKPGNPAHNQTIYSIGMKDDGEPVNALRLPFNSIVAMQRGTIESAKGPFTKHREDVLFIHQDSGRDFVIKCE